MLFLAVTVSFDLVTFIFELDIDSIKLNQHATYLVKGFSVCKLLFIHIDIHTHMPD